MKFKDIKMGKLFIQFIYNSMLSMLVGDETATVSYTTNQQVFSMKQEAPSVRVGIK